MSAERVQLGEITVRVYERGPEPEYHKDRALWGPWLPYQAELAGQPDASATGWTPYEAILRLVSMRRAVLVLVQSNGVGRVRAELVALVRDGARRYTVPLELTRGRCGRKVTAVGS